MTLHDDSEHDSDDIQDNESSSGGSAKGKKRGRGAGGSGPRGRRAGGPAKSFWQWHALMIGFLDENHRFPPTRSDDFAVRSLATWWMHTKAQYAGTHAQVKIWTAPEKKAISQLLARAKPSRSLKMPAASACIAGKGTTKNGRARADGNYRPLTIIASDSSAKSAQEPAGAPSSSRKRPHEAEFPCNADVRHERDVWHPAQHSGERVPKAARALHGSARGATPLQLRQSASGAGSGEGLGGRGGSGAEGRGISITDAAPKSVAAQSASPGIQSSAGNAHAATREKQETSGGSAMESPRGGGWGGGGGGGRNEGWGRYQTMGHFGPPGSRLSPGGLTNDLRMKTRLSPDGLKNDLRVKSRGRVGGGVWEHSGVVVVPAQHEGASSTNESLTTKGAGALTSPSPRKSCVSTGSGPSSAPALAVSESAAIGLQPFWATRPPPKTRFQCTASGTDTVENISLDQSLHYVVGCSPSGPNRVVDFHETVSLDHAVITFLDEMVFVKDLGSTSGTHIGGLRIGEGSKFVELFDKDWVRFGESNIDFCLRKPPMSVIQTRLLNTITNLFSKTHKDIHTL